MERSQRLATAEFVPNYAIHMVIGHNPFYWNVGDHIVAPLTSLLQGVLSNVDAVQTMVDRIKTTLEEAQANPTITLAQSERICKQNVMRGGISGWQPRGPINMQFVLGLALAK